MAHEAFAPRALALLRARGELATSQVADRLGWPAWRASRVLRYLWAARKVARRRAVDLDDEHTTWTLWRAL